MTQSHRHKRKPRRPSPRELALHAWLDDQLADPVAARLALRVIGMHAGLVEWMHDAERSRVYPSGALDGGSGFVTETREPDDAMLRLVDQRLAFDGPFDPEHLDPVRIRMNAKLGELAAWYGQGSQMWVDVAEWEPLAVRLGDLIGDQVAANALALCCIRHARLAYSPDEQTQARRKAARERWRRLAAWYVRVLDEQPTRSPSDQAAERYQTVGPDGERRLG